jgi:hypothetical protein
MQELDRYQEKKVAVWYFGTIVQDKHEIDWWEGTHQ